MLDCLKIKQLKINTIRVFVFVIANIWCCLSNHITKGADEMDALQGIIPAMLTPLNQDEEINEPVTRQLVNRLIEAKVNGIFSLGTNGEFFTLSASEKVSLARIIVEETNKRVPVFVGTGGNSTKEVIELSKEMEEVGVDILSIITPFFDPPSQVELVKHYEKIAASVDLPIVLYNMPSRTGLSLAPTTVKELAKVPNIIGIKDSSGSLDNILKYIDETRDEDFAVLSGSDSLILPTLMAGGAGGIAATANMFPELVVSIYTYWKQGEFIKAQEAQNKLMAIRSISTIGTTPSVFKKAVELLGIPVGPPRSPVTELTEDKTEKLKTVLALYK